MNQPDKNSRPIECEAVGQAAAKKTRILVFSGVIGWVLWRTVYLMKLPRLEKKIRVGLQWARELVLERDIAQYINPRDVESVYRLLETARQPHGAPTPKVSAAEPRHVGSERIGS
jgi:hypothetical protein